MMSRIIKTSAFDTAYPQEQFVNTPSLPYNDAETVRGILCNALGNYSPWWYKVVEDDYKLSPGFEP